MNFRLFSSSPQGDDTKSTPHINFSGETSNTPCFIKIKNNIDSNKSSQMNISTKSGTRRSACFTSGSKSRKLNQQRMDIIQQKPSRPQLPDQERFRQNILYNKFGRQKKKRLMSPGTQKLKIPVHSIYSQNNINSEKQMYQLQPGKYLSKHLEKIFDRNDVASPNKSPIKKQIQNSIIQIIDKTGDNYSQQPLPFLNSSARSSNRRIPSPAHLPISFQLQEKPPNFMTCIFQAHQDCDHFLQIANDDQFRQVHSLLDQYYDVHPPQKRDRLGQFSMKHLNTQKNIDAAQRRQIVRTKIDEINGVKNEGFSMRGNSVNGSVRGKTSRSANKTQYDYVSALLGVMRELDNQYTLNPYDNEKASNSSQRLRRICKPKSLAPKITMMKKPQDKLLRFVETSQHNPSEPLYEDFSTFDRDCKTFNMIEIDNIDQTVKNINHQRKSIDGNSPCFPEVQEIGIASPKKRGCQSTKDLLNHPQFKRQLCVTPLEIEMMERKQQLEDKFEFYGNADNDIINKKINELDEHVSQYSARSARSGRSVAFSTFSKPVNN